MNDDDLRLAPAGASDAACAVCLHMTFNHIVVGDGHVPICSGFCLQAWPRVRDLIADRDEWRRQHENALASWQADMRALKAKQDVGLAALALLTLLTLGVFLRPMETSRSAAVDFKQWPILDSKIGLILFLRFLVRCPRLPTDSRVS